MPHENNKRPSTQPKHQKGLTAAKNAQENKLWQEYKKNGGRLSKDAWEKKGMPKKNK